MNRPDEPTRQNDAQATDADLAIAAMRGDSEAFGVLIVRLRSAVIGYVAGLIRNQDEAEDIAQEAFLAAWRNLGGLREPACVGHWIFRIAHNLATKRAKRRPDISLAFDPAIPVPDPRGQERLLGLLAAVGRLSEEHREVIMRKHFGGYSGSEVAEQLGIAPGTVRSRLSRAYADLRNLMEADACKDRAAASNR